VTEPFAAVPPPWSRLDPALAAVLRDGLVGTADAVAGAVRGDVPAFAQLRSPKFEQDLQRAVRVALEQFVDLAGAPARGLRPEVRQTFVALGAAEARDGRGPEVLLAALRLASRRLLRAAAEALGADRTVPAEELLDLSDAVTAFVDELAAASTDGYTRQVRELAGETDRRRRRLAELLVHGGAPEAAVRSAAAAAGWRRLDLVVPVLLPLDQVRDARFRHGADGVVLDREADAVLLLRAGARTARDRLDLLLGSRAVVGPALPWDRVPLGVRLAEVTAHLSRPDTGPVFTDDHLVPLALNGEPEALAVLAGRRLAAFAGLPDTTRERLLETLHSWLVHWGSRADVAAELFVHPQTVSYRLKRVRELLGEAVDRPAERLELLLVLSARQRTV